MYLRCLLLVVVLLPVIAVALSFLAGANLSERHHVHHDTYLVSLVVSRTFALVMVFMGVLGGLVGWLCHLGVFAAEAVVAESFFVAFQLTLLFMFVAAMRYQVTAYDDRMIVRQPFGPNKTIRYGDIASMEWRPSFLGPNLRDLWIISKAGKRTRLWCLLDIEQLLLRIDRFDTLAR